MFLRALYSITFRKSRYAYPDFTINISPWIDIFIILLQNIYRNPIICENIQPPKAYGTT